MSTTRKPRTIIVCKRFRLVRGSWGYSFIEERDGKDAMGCQRWKTAKSEDYGRVLDEIATALVQRDKKARAKRRSQP